MIKTVALIFMLLPGLSQAATDTSCPGMTTREIEVCLRSCVDQAEAALSMIEAEIVIHGYGEAWSRQFQAALASWSDFVEADCKAAYESAVGGSIRNIWYLGCKLSHTEHRAMSLWSQYLEGVDTDIEEPTQDCANQERKSLQVSPKL